MSDRCRYGQALIAARDGAEPPAGYEFVTSEDGRLRSHDRFCRECAVAPDSTHPDAAHLRRARGADAA